jgi:hypothetical protein
MQRRHFDVAESVGFVHFGNRHQVHGQQRIDVAVPRRIRTLDALHRRILTDSPRNRGQAG